MASSDVHREAWPAVTYTGRHAGEVHLRVLRVLGRVHLRVLRALGERVTRRKELRREG